MLVKSGVEDRLRIIAETGLICIITSVSGLAYLFGDLSKNFSEEAYKVGAQLDVFSLELFERTMDVMERHIWKEIKE